VIFLLVPLILAGFFFYSFELETLVSGTETSPTTEVLAQIGAMCYLRIFALSFWKCCHCFRSIGVLARELIVGHFLLS
jgi:hypothetical protein